MRRTTRAAATVGVLTALGTLAACGGDGEADVSLPNVPDTLSRSTWISEVNEVCTAHNNAIGAIIGPLFAAGSPAPDDARAALDEIVERTRQVTTDIADLPEPSALTVHIDALVAALDAGSDRAEELGGAAFFASEEDPYRRAGDIAGELGLDACDTQD